MSKANKNVVCLERHLCFMCHGRSFDAKLTVSSSLQMPFHSYDVL